MALGISCFRISISPLDHIRILHLDRWRTPPLPASSGAKNPPLGSSASKGGNLTGDDGWDSWDSENLTSSSDIRRNQSVGDFRVGSGGERGAQPPSRSRSTENIYTRGQLEASTANKETFFSRKVSENASRPVGIPPSQGGKYVGFGSTLLSSAQRNNSSDDTVSIVSQGLGRLSFMATSAVQSAANVVQAGTKDLASKVSEGVYDQKVNETVDVVATKTTEIGQRTWGIMRGVMALASQKVEEYTKEGINWKGDDWQWKERGNIGSNPESGLVSRYQNTSEDNTTRHYNSTSSWDDWDDNQKKEEHGKERQSNKDDEYETYSLNSSNATNQNTKFGFAWSESGFR